VGVRPGVRPVPGPRRHFRATPGRAAHLRHHRLAAFLATIATPLAPYWLTGVSLFVALLLVQLLLGCSQAATFPVSAGVFEAWFPPRSWTTVQGLQTMGLSLGAALTPPLIANLMSAMGWQRALLWASLPAIGLI